MDTVTEIISKDPLLMITIIISIISLVFIIILVNYYKKIKEQQIISQIISSSEEQKTTQEKKQKPVEQINKPVVSADGQKGLQQDIDIVIAQLNEVTKQINLINNHIKDLSSIVKNLQDKPISESVISEETITKLVNILHQLETQIGTFQKSTQSSTSSIEEINKKVDNLLKLLSTILQQ